MAKSEEAIARMFGRKFICRKCKSVTKADTMKVLAEKVKCRNCGSKKLRPPRKK